MTREMMKEIGNNLDDSLTSLPYEEEDPQA